MEETKLAGETMARMKNSGRRHRQSLLIAVPLSAVPIGLVLALGFSYWPGIALSIGGVGIAVLNYRALRRKRPPT
jgi:hypothetical protein